MDKAVGRRLLQLQSESEAILLLELQLQLEQVPLQQANSQAGRQAAANGTGQSIS